MNPLQELRTRAEILHHRIRTGDHHALGRLRVLPAYRKLSFETLSAAPPAIRRSDCLSVIAHELGFVDWPSAKAAISGGRAVENFGSFLYPKCGGGLNLWFKTYQEAQAVHAEKGGYLMAYGRHFIVAESLYIEALGLDPNDPDWVAIGFNWVRPLDEGARTRLCCKLVAALPRPTQ